VQTYLTVPVEQRFTNVEKHLLRTAFQHLLPESIAWRKKEAFSDGVSSMAESWYQIIQRKVPAMGFAHQHVNPPMTAEQQYYRHIFDRHYAEAATTIPYFWMPRFVQATDCSARSLAIYK
jgi:asparagine synthase (glutamine-hydrolysing)